MNLPDTIRKTIEDHGLIPDGAKVVVGVSGGADSVALLRALHALDIPVTIAHLNHRLRGAESDADETFVRKLGFPTVVQSVDIRGLAQKRGVSIEMAARKARHGFFAEFADATIALAHHADDQAETFLLKLARGAGTEGLGGMPYGQWIDGLRIIRPMLDIPRTQIVEWMEENGFAWREDASNSDEAFLRNKVRHTIIPMLERELNPNIRATLLRTMDILREENAWMAEMQNQSQTLAARRRRLRQWLFDNGAEEAGFDAVDKILALMEQGKGTTVFELNGRQRIVVEYGNPRFEESEGKSTAPTWSLSVKTGTGWRKNRDPGIGILPAEASFDANRVGNAPIEVRTWRPGDRLEPLGMEGSRKLQDIFTDLKVPRTERHRLAVVVCRGEIVWLPGYRIARDWAVKGRNGKSVHVRIEQNEAG